MSQAASTASQAALAGVRAVSGLMRLTGAREPVVPGGISVFALVGWLAIAEQAHAGPDNTDLTRT
jgi:hypothetical protein